MIKRTARQRLEDMLDAIEAIKWHMTHVYRSAIKAMS